MAAVTFVAIANRHDRSQNRSTPRLNHAAGSPAFRRIAMTGLARRRVDPEIVPRGDWLTGVALHSITIQHDELFDARLFAEALDHLCDQGAVIPHHLVLKCGSDQFSFSECAGMDGIENAPEVIDRINVRGDRTSHNHRRGYTQRKTYGHAGKAQLHHDAE
jgi:hypothetical protein